MVSGDEVGMLSISFNQMLDGLQERERLRAHNTELSTALEESLEEVRASRARIVRCYGLTSRRRMAAGPARRRSAATGERLKRATASPTLLLKDLEGAAVLHDELRADAARAVDELRDLAHGIYPPLPESDGLTSALEDVADQSALAVAVESDGADRYPAAVEAAVYFCCLEALQNVAKHAGPGSRATISLDNGAGVLRFRVPPTTGGGSTPRPGTAAPGCRT